jgi:hypothetical protein
MAKEMEKYYNGSSSESNWHTVLEFVSSDIRVMNKSFNWGSQRPGSVLSLTPFGLKSKALPFQAVYSFR